MLLFKKMGALYPAFFAQSLHNKQPVVITSLLPKQHLHLIHASCSGKG